MINAVIFDMDGLMFDTESLWVDEGFLLAQKLGYNLPKELFYKTIGLKNREAGQIFSNYLNNYFDMESFRTLYHKYISEKMLKEGIKIKPGLKELIEKINSGDSSITPYMDFANTYPVRDSMRMMRLLYRLGLGGQEKKQERLLMFSRTVSNLQAKARETKYKERLDHMGNQTMIMLVVTGISVMVVILASMMTMIA